ncbi:hydroxyacid dehydrogenase [candidate division KSB1 bacterium]|nr:hydroxyacid dehydrogenase [candidate division KSB1 bacterium]
MKIAFFEIKGWEKTILRRGLKGHTVEFFHDPLNAENVKHIEDFDIVSVFIYSIIDESVLNRLPNLKAIATRSTGFDHIDLEACEKRGIGVFNVPFYGENTVAEHTFALILSLSRNVHKAYMKTIRWDFSIDGLIGFDLKGKTLGVIGAGFIGLNVIRIAKGFDMNVIVFDVNKNKMISEVLGFKYVSMDELLANSDIITLHVPYNKHTHHLINRDSIKKIKKGAVLINTSRGGVAETEALIEALDSKILSGIGLDVLEGEGLIKEEKQLLYDPQKLEDMGKIVKDHILLSKENVVFTPHIAFYSHEALERILETSIDNINSFINGKFQNQVISIKA